MLSITSLALKDLEVHITNIYLMVHSFKFPFIIAQDKIILDVLTLRANLRFAYPLDEGDETATHGARY